MTEDEKKQLRNRKLLAYHDAADDYGASCGQVTEFMARVRKFVKLFDSSRLGLKKTEEGELLFWETTTRSVLLGAGESAFTLPSQQELATAIQECRDAEELEAKAYSDASQSGVNTSRLNRPRVNSGITDYR